MGRLEDALGTRLLNRSTRHIGLTEAGRLYYERAARIVADVDEANAAVAELAEAPRGTLRLNVPVVFGRRYIAPYMREFLETHPEVHVDLNVTDRYVDLIEEGADLAIRIGGPSQSSYIVRKLATIDRVLCASPDYFARHGRPRHPEDLARHNCIALRRHPGDIVWELIGGDGTFEIPASGNFASNNSVAIAAAMTAGIGIALLAGLDGGPRDPAGQGRNRPRRLPRPSHRSGRRGSMRCFPTRGTCRPRSAPASTSSPASSAKSPTSRSGVSLPEAGEPS